MFRLSLSCILAAATLACGVLAAHPARADEFATVPVGDPLYRHLASVTQAGWRGVPQGADTTMTRYEMALETAKAIFTVTARQQANKTWALSVPRSAVRALREMTSEFQAELKSLGVDTPAALQLCDNLLRPVLPPPAPSAVVPSVAPSVASAESVADRLLLPGTSVVSENSARRQSRLQMPLSQRLRISTALSVLEREARDPLGDAALGVRRTSGVDGAVQRGSGLDAALPVGASGADAMKADVSLGVTDWLTLRAGYGQQPLAPRRLSMETLSLQEPFVPRVGEGRTLSGGVDVALRRGVVLSGSMENTATDVAGGLEWTRIGGGLELSAWQNRLSLKANMSRLVPEDARVLPSTVAGLNVGLGVTERLSLTLLYQQLFGAPGPAHADRMVAGGISINF